MSNLPGAGKHEFTILFDHDWCKRGDILKTDRGYTLEVTKVYRYTRWKRFLVWLCYIFHIKCRIKICQVKAVVK